MSLLKDRVTKKNHLGPITARIRPGQKVPTKATLKASETNPALAQILRDVGDGRLSSREAEKRIFTLTNGAMKYPFTPKNTPYFNISAADFSAPELGGIGVVKLLEMYGEEREGTPGKRLWRIPMVFADVSDVERIFPSEFRVAQGQNLYRSQYIEGERHCMELPPVEKDHAKRRHQERTPRSRGLCDPDYCAEFGSGACKFSGTLRFHIPGFPGIAPFVMGTTSTYASEDIYFQLEQVIQKMGRIPRTKPDGSPIFWLVKSQKQRSYFDENGEKKHGLQWVPDLVAEIDFPLMLEAAERQALAAPSHRTPLAWLTKEPATEPPQAPMERSMETTSAGSSYETPPQEQNPSVVADDDSCEFTKLANENKVPSAMTWANLRFGQGWEQDPANSAQAMKVLRKLLQLGDRMAEEVLNFKTIVLQNHLDDKLVDEFSKQRFGERLFKDLTVLTKAKAMLVEMLESGVEVAQAYMRNELSKAA